MMAEILKYLRKKANLTLRQVEDYTGISNAYLSQLENGKVKKPSAQTMYVLSKLYKTDIEYLLIETGLVKVVEIPNVEIKVSFESRLDELERRVDALFSKDIVFGG